MVEQLLNNDIFSYIIDLNDMKVQIRLYNTNRAIRKLCDRSKFMQVLVKFSKHAYFNPDIKSPLLDAFLNDLSGNDPDYLKLIQNTFGLCLYKNMNKKIIALDGDSNGKSTFLFLLNKLMGHLYMKHHPKKSCPGDAKYALFLELQEVNIQKYSSGLKFLSGGDSYFFHGSMIIPNFTPIIHDYYNYDNLHSNIERRLIKIDFKTQFGLDKVNDPTMTEKLLDNHHVISALLTFLLQGCKNML